MKVKKQMNLFILPGNPPAMHFYELWKTEILKRDLKYRIKISTYPRFDLKQSSDNYMRKTLDFQKKEFSEFQEQNGQPVTIIGHSFGGFLALSLFEEFSHDIKNCLLLNPFLRAPGPRGLTILKLLQTLHSLPSFEKIFLASRPLLTKISPTLKKISTEEIKTSLNLTYHEYYSIGLNQDRIEINPKLQHKLHLFYSLHDTWCQPKIVSELKTQISHHSCSTSHTFILTKAGRDKMFEKIETYLD